MHDANASPFFIEITVANGPPMRGGGRQAQDGACGCGMPGQKP